MTRRLELGATPRVIAMFALLACVLAACSGDDDGDPPPTPPPMGDAGTDSGPPPSVQVLMPSEPAPAADVVPSPIVDCPSRWTIAEDGTCEPYAADARPSACDDVSFQPPGEATCIPVGTPCPAGDWPETIPDGGRVVYVRAGSPAGGAGTMASPLATIASGIAMVASGGGVVVVAKGSYSEAIRVPADVTIVGACAAETEIVCPALRMQAIAVLGANVVLRDLHASCDGEAIGAMGASADFTAEGMIFGPATRRAVSVLEGAHATLRGCAMRDAIAGVVGERGGVAVVEGSVIERTLDAAVALNDEGTHVTLTQSRVGETRRVTGGVLNAGVGVQTGASLAVVASVIASSSRTGARAITGGTMTITDSLVDGVLGVSTGDGYGIEAASGGVIRVERTLVRDVAGAGVIVNGAGSEVTLVDSVLRGSRTAEPPEHDNEGAFVRSDGRLVVERTRFEGFRTGGVAVLGEGATLVATDVTLRDMVGTLDGLAGRGLEVGRGATAELHRVRAERVREVAILLTDAGSTVVGEDLVVVGTLEQAIDSHSGRALQIQQGAVVDLARVRLEDSLDLAVAIRDPGTLATLLDLVVARVGADVGEARFGRGVEVILGARLSISRARIEETTEVAVVVSDEGTTLDVEDLVIARTLGAADGSFGRGVEVIAAGTVSIARAVLEGNRDAALLASGGSSVELVDVLVTDTAAATCGEACVPGTTGLGLAAIGGATIAARRFVVRDQASMGVQVADGASLDLESGEVSGCAIGANVGIEGYVVRRVLAPDVAFHSNERDLSLDVLPALVPLPRRD